MVDSRWFTRGAPCRCIGSLAMAMAVLTAPGCAEELGPTRRETAHVHGRVHLGSSPITGGWIEFTPVDGTVGVLRSAPIQADGSFDAAGVALGTNLIRLAHPSPQPATPYLDPKIYWLFQQSFSPIRRTLRAPSETLDIDLRRESQTPETARTIAELARQAG